MRRVLVATAAAVLATTMGLVPSASADDTTTSGVWSGSTLVPDPRPSECDRDDLCGTFRRANSTFLGVPYRHQVSILFELVPAASSTSPGCALPANPGPEPAADSPNAFTRALAFECNGTYHVKATATADRSGGTHILERDIVVADPAPDVDPPTAVAGAGRSVAVSWTPLANAPKDFRGYLVLRTSAAGATEQVAALSPAESSWTDASPPAEGGTFTYQVRTRRAGANPTDPADEVSSSGTTSAPVDVAASPGPAGGGGDGGGAGGTGGGTDGGTDGGTGGTGGGTTGGTGGGGGGGTAGGTGGSSPSLSTPSFRVPRVGTPSRNFFPPLLAPPDTFEGELPYGDREPGEEDAVLPDDELASGPHDQAPGRGLVIPLATGLVLAVWALHLRFLARAAQPAYVDVDDDPTDIVFY